MRASIIVPVYNERATLPDFLERMARHLESDRRGSELILVDGGSDDGSVELARRAGWRVHHSERGRASQMNAGARQASGDLLLFLHVDTRLPSGALGRVRRTIEDGAVGGWFDVRLDSDRPLLRLTGRLITWRSRLTGVASGDQAIFVARDAFEKLGGYAPLPLFEDLDLCRRMKRLGRVVSLDPPVVTSCRRWEQWGVLRTILKMWGLRTLYYMGVDPRLLARYYGLAR